MTHAPLEEQVDAFFREALARVAPHPALHSLARVLEESLARIRQPMRVAVVGMIKAGKSTMMNALLGEQVVATGTAEATFNVNWLRWGPQRGLRLHFKDASRPPEERSYDELAAVTVRAEENSAFLLSIDHVEVSHPAGMLRTLNLIDTPGLASVYEDDAENTRAFLKVHGDELSRSTRAHESRADAILHLYSRALHEQDQRLVDEFHGGNATPINALAVFTKAELLWPSEADPMAAAEEMAKRRRADAGLARRYYAFVPTAGKLALGAQLLRPGDLEALGVLAALPDAAYQRFLSLTRNVHKIRRDDPEIPVAGETRRRLADLLTAWGLVTACGLLRGGTAPDDLPRALLDVSGVPRLRELILTHFGNRALMIKLSTAFGQIHACCVREEGRHPPHMDEVVRWVDGERERLEAAEHGFRELEVLREYYEGRLPLTDDEVRDVLEVSGENGRTLAERVGLPADADLDAVEEAANRRHAYWSYQETDLTRARHGGADPAFVLRQSYARILHRLASARRCLAEAEAFLRI